MPLNPPVTATTNDSLKWIVFAAIMGSLGMGLIALFCCMMCGSLRPVREKEAAAAAAAAMNEGINGGLLLSESDHHQPHPEEFPPEPEDDSTSRLTR